MVAQALEQIDGVYQIGSLDDYKAFAELVNGGTTDANAVLTADIDLGEDATMIATSSEKPYTGVFDGQGHSISIAWKDAVYDCGIFQYMSGTVRNLRVTGSLQSVNQHPGTIVGRAHDKGGTTIENVYCDVEMNITHGYDTGGGGIIAFSAGAYKMTNVVFAGKMIGDGVTEHCGGFVGWSGGTGDIKNCLFVGEVTGVAFNSLNSFNYVGRGPGAVWENVYYIPVGTDYIPSAYPLTAVESEDVKSGALAFILNGYEQGGKNFYQTIGEDEAPIPFANGHSLVYCKADEWLCNGVPLGHTEYTNEPQVKTQPAHNMDEGFCSICGTWDETYMQPASDGWYEVENANQLAWWSVLAGKNQLANMRLTADIEMSEEANDHYVAPGTSAKPFCGHIDGQHHIISGLTLTSTSEDSPIGLIAVMNSEPVKPTDEAAARAAEPAYIKNLRLDETCTVSGVKHVAGFIGQAREWAGNILLENVGMEGTVNGEGGVNCGGLLGCAPGQPTACTITFRNSYVSGSVHGVQEDGLLTGWMGYNSTIENCYGIGECDAPRGEESYLAYPTSNIVLNNVYSINGTQGNIIDQEKVSNGELCVSLIGSNYDKLAWYQTIGEDDFPVNDPTHAIVVKAGESCIAINDDAEVEDAVSNIQTAEYEYLDEAMAEQRLIDDCRTLAQALSEVKTKSAFLPAYAQMLHMRDTIIASTKVYAAYVTKCQEVREYIDSHNDFVGADREALENYLKSNAEPNQDWPLGGYTYITENHLAADSLINQEIERVQQMLDKAIAGGYQPGMDVTSLLTNPDFSDGSNGWTGTAFSTWEQKVQETTWYVGENYSTDSVNISQTLTGLKPGYYLVTMNAATCANGNRYSYDQHAVIFANNNTAIIPVVREDMITPEAAIDGENCLLTTDLSEHPLFDDGFSTSKTDDNEIIGYIPRGLAAMAYAMNGKRYQMAVLTKVGEDGNLTVGLRRNASEGLSFQLLFGNTKLTYCGTEADAPTATAIKEVLDKQTARANTLLTAYDPNDPNQAPARNYPAQLKKELEENVASAQAAEGVSAQESALYALSTTLDNILDGKEAYYAMLKKSETMESIANVLGTSLGDDQDMFYNAIDSVNNAYNNGSITAQEARTMGVFDTDVFKSLIPQQDEDGIYQIANGKQFVSFSVLANAQSTLSAVLLNDMDMTSLSWQPIGTKNKPYHGVFDGKGHRISNLVISLTTDYTGIFGYVTDGAVIRNFVVDNTCTIEGGSYTAVIGGNTTAGNIVVESVGMEGTIIGSGANVAGLYGTNMGSKANLYITNCYVTGPVTGGRESAAICGWSGGKIGTFTNCFTNSDVKGYYFEDGKDYIIRNLNVTMKHVFSTKGIQGTIITDEQLASGAICYILNEGNTTNPKWYQTLGTDPVPTLDPTHGIVGMTADSTYTNQAADWKTAPELIMDIVFNEDSTATDASDLNMTVEKIGTPEVYYNEELKRNVVRLDNEWGSDATSFFKVDFEQNMLFRSGLENSHSLEMLLSADCEGAMPDVTANPFSAMQTGGTGFETAAVDGVRQFRFNANASPLYISTWARCDSKVAPEGGKFYHVVGVWDKEAGQALIYVNGELMATTDLPGNVVFPTVGCNWFGIGGDPGSTTKATNAWRGDIAIARVYSKAITAEQVASLYKSTGTGIAETVAEQSNKSTGIYTINGIRVQKTDKGLYIINGRKVVVK